MARALRAAKPVKAAESAVKDPLCVTGEKFDYEEQVGHLLRRAMQRHISIFEKNCPDHQLTAVQFAVLCAALDNAPVSQNQLARLCAIDPSTMKGVIERLSDRNLLQLAADTKDRRKVLIQPTEAGAELVARMVPVGFRISNATMGSLNAAERVALIYLLKKMLAE